jgi:hypothetical protein
MLTQKLSQYGSATTEEAAPPATAALAERRAAPRVPVIKSAKVFVGAGIGQSVFNCLVLDESATGVLVDLGTLANLPELVTLQMGGGGTYAARRCWAVGTKAGLEFVGGQVISGETALRMRKVADILVSQGTIAAVGTLRAARFFDHQELRRAAEEAEAAYFRFEAILTGRASI